MPVLGRELNRWEVRLSLGDVECCLDCAGKALKWALKKASDMEKEGK